MTDKEQFQESTEKELASIQETVDELLKDAEFLFHYNRIKLMRSLGLDDPTLSMDELRIEAAMKKMGY